MKAERDVDAFYSRSTCRTRSARSSRRVISGVAEFGLFCELEEVFVEASSRRSAG